MKQWVLVALLASGCSDDGDGLDARGSSTCAMSINVVDNANQIFYANEESPTCVKGKASQEPVIFIFKTHDGEVGVSMQEYTVGTHIGEVTVVLADKAAIYHQCSYDVIENESLSLVESRIAAKGGCADGVTDLQFRAIINFE